MKDRIIDILIAAFLGALIAVLCTQAKNVLGTKIVENIDTHGQLTVSDSASSTFSNTLKPAANNTHDIGGFAYAWRNVFASNTVYASNLSVDGSTTSTIKTDLLVGKVAGTSTLQVGTNIAAKGGCVAISTGNANEFLNLIAVNVGDHIELTTSTKAADCY